MNSPSDKVIKVCVVGAGAAGLCAARHLAADPKRFEFSVFERQSDLGGTWIYTEKIGLDEDGLPIHSSMYRDLRTNLPKEIMTFPDYPTVESDNGSCVSHNDILKYLKSYATHFQLRPYIKFHTIVESVKLKKSDVDEWQVGVKNVKTNKTETLIFDSVIICNGHYYNTRIPQIPGLADFRGQVLHSHNYRKPEAFAGIKVILLGAGSSGIDIASELTEVASFVYLSHTKPKLGMQCPNFEEVAGIEKFADGKFVLKDDSSIEADCLIYCTGYHFTYPFLDDSSGVKIVGYPSPLYKHLINANHPSMCFIGLLMIVVPFPMFHMQVQYFLSTLRDKSRLPLSRVMLEEESLQASKKNSHKLSGAQWAYNNDLAQAGNFDPLPAYYQLGYEAWSKFRLAHLKDYKKFDLLVSSDGKSVSIVDPKDKD